MKTPEQNDLLLGRPSFPGAAGGPGQPEALRQQWLQALAADLDAGLQSVSGDFAVGITLPSGKVVLAVDRFAVRTLCYRVQDGALRFAERADTLADSSTPVDPQAIFDYLYFHAIPSPRTIFQGIYRLPPGHVATFDQGELSVRPYWVPTFNEPSAASFSSLRDEFLSLLEGAVARQLDGSRPACFLSGGTDSSTVAGMIGRVSGEPAHCYSIGFEAEGYDEMAFARIAAKRFGCHHHEYYVTPDDLVRSIPQVAAYHDQPFGNSSAVPAFHCAEMARADGVTRLLAGDGGDELFGGNSRYAKQRVFGWYGAVPGGLRAGMLEPLLESTPLGALPLLRKGRSYVEQAKVPMPDRLQMYNLLRRLGVEQVLSDGFLRSVDQGAPLAGQRQVWKQAHTRHEINRMLAFDWRYTLAETDLPKVRGSTQLAGVGVGYPMLDQALLAFSLKLPAAYKLKGLKLRWFFKEALRGFLPDEIITKKKQGFGLPFGVWANRHAPLKQLATDSLHSLSQRGLIQPAFIRQLISDLLPAHPGYYGEMVWILMMLEQWLQAHQPAFRYDGHN